ncbi:MAG: domain S-box protein [Mucilaginibacter sp.]|nr:domain S-box protein [Mucilaginibacter sp.]
MKDIIVSHRQQNEGFSQLRFKAEKALKEIEQDNVDLQGKDIKILIQELQVYQIELEMQNDELRSANEQLERQQIKFTGIYDLAPVGYFILSNTGRIEEVNNAGAKLFETGKNNVIYKKLQNFIAREYVDIFYRFYRQMLITRESHTCELKMIAQNGREFYAHVEGIGIHQIINSPVQCYLAIIDVTERIQAEKKLAETKERLELALEASAAGIWELELDTMKFYMDEFNYKLCSVPNGWFDGTYKTFISLMHTEDQEMVDQHFRTALNNEKKIDVVSRVLNSENQPCYVSIRGHIVAEPDAGKRFVGIMIDITEKRRMEEESANLKQDQQKVITQAILNAQESERKRISDSLHDGVSQLIYGIKMKLALQQSKSVDNAPGNIYELLDMAIQEIRNISFELAPSILADFGLPITIEELAKRLSTPQMKIKTKIIGFKERLGLPLETNIFRMIQELINNCMKHADANLITVEIRKGKQIEIKLQDNGKGFNVKAQENHPSGSGLSSIKNRLSLYNGNMVISSNSTTGTTIKMSLDYKNH